MSQLPARPDLDQLRRQARELHRAAQGGDARATRRLQQVSGTATLSAAQLAVAREYGFASWPRLKAEAERRRAEASPPGPAARGQAGQAAREARLPPRRRLRGKRCASPARLPAGAERPDRGPVRGPSRPAGRSRHVAGGGAGAGPGDGAAPQDLRQPGHPRRTFAVVQATTRRRVDLGLRLDHARPGGRLLAANGGVGAATLRIPLATPGDVDAEVLRWLQRAYDESSGPPPARRPARRPAR